MIYEFEVPGKIIGKGRPRVNSYTGIVYTPTVSHAEKVELIMEIMEVVYEDGYTQGKEDLRDLLFEVLGEECE